jgi:hypothetical protein
VQQVNKQKHVRANIMSSHRHDEGREAASQPARRYQPRTEHAKDVHDSKAARIHRDAATGISYLKDTGRGCIKCVDVPQLDVAKASTMPFNRDGAARAAEPKDKVRRLGWRQV